MATLVEYKCPNCGGNIKFNSTKQQLQCESCDSVFTEEQLSQYENMFSGKENETNYNWQQSGDEAELEGMNTYSCQSCGAQIVADDTTAASECPYCGSPVLMTGKLSGMNRPNCVIPFKLDKNQATAALKKFYKGKILLPKVFKDENRVKEMKAMYVPFWLFDCDTDSTLTYEGIKIRTWRDSDYNYTENTYYSVLRSGRVGFADIPVDGSTKMADEYMDGIEPFNYKDMVEFNPAYLSGFIADKYDVSAQESFPRAESRVTNSTIDEFAKTVNGFDIVNIKNTNINAENSVYKYALLPVWMFTTKFNGKIYHFAINGQTGKVAGDLPIDKKKQRLITAGIAAAITAIGQIFVFLL